MNNIYSRRFGFTLVEILVALFIFTLLSLLMVSGLRTVINAQAGSENKGEALRKLQIVLLIMSRDIEQIVNRPIIDASGQEEAAFVGTLHSMRFTHTGFANSAGTVARSTLQRAGYAWSQKTLSRLNWPVLDQAPQTMPHTRKFLADAVNAEFHYLDSDGNFHATWPVDELKNQPLPRGVKIILSIAHWGDISQLYLIPSSAGTAQEPVKKWDTSHA